MTETLREKAMRIGGIASDFSKNLGLVANIAIGLGIGSAIVAWKWASHTDLTSGLRQRKLSEEEIKMARENHFELPENFDSDPQLNYFIDNGNPVKIESFYRRRYMGGKYLSYEKDVVTTSTYDPLGFLIKRTRTYAGDSRCPEQSSTVEFKPGSWIGRITEKR